LGPLRIPLFNIRSRRSLRREGEINVRQIILT
jgi:hypothetical protein